MNYTTVFLSALCLFSWWGTSPGGSAPPPSATSSPQAISSAAPVVRAILRNYRLMASLHFNATITGRADPAAIRAVGSKAGVLRARFVFWGAGRRYRTNYSVISPAAFQAEDCQVAFDGRRFQLLYAPTRTLYISKKRPVNAVVPIIPNPALMPAMFLAPLPDAKRPSNPSLSQLQQPHSSLVTAFWRRFSKDGGRFICGANGGPNALVAPAGTMNGIPVSYVVTVSRRIRSLPRRIVVVDQHGKRSARVQFSRYRAFKVGRSSVYVPSQINDAVWGAGTLPALTETIRLHQIAVGGRMPPGIFVIDFHMANVVLDGDKRTAQQVPRSGPP